MIFTNNLKVLFMVLSSRVNKFGKAPIYCKLTISRDTKRFSTDISIDPGQWSQEGQQAIENSDECLNINTKLADLKNQILKVESYFIKIQQPYSVQDIINKLKNKDSVPFRTLLQAYSYKLKQMEALKGKQYAESSLEKAMQMQRVVEEFLINEMQVKDLQLVKVNIQFLTEFENYLKGKRNMALSYSNKNIQKLKSIMKMAFEFGVIDKPAFPNHKFKHEKPKVIYLTIDELEKLEHYKFVQKRFYLVRDLFLFSVYTGLHYSDAMSLQQTNIIKGIDDKDWIVYTRQKTGVEIHIPILEKTKQLLFKFEDSNKEEGYLLPKFSNQKVNSYLKEIADIVGINKPLSHKIARKTFGSVLLYYNVPMKVVSKLMGHSSVLITERHYADVELRKLGEEMNRVNEIL